MEVFFLCYRIEVLQSPQRGRTPCNEAFLIPQVEPNKLAVPSDGSNLLQLLLSSAAMCSCASCSTLRRVEPLATTRQTRAPRATRPLYNPQTGRPSSTFSSS